MSLGERIQQLRKARGLSQEQLADSLNVSRQAVSKWETDQSSPEIENILALSRVFLISTDELLGNDIAGAPGASITPAREEKRQFGFTRRMHALVSFIDRKAILMFFTLLCFVAAGVCVIVNYAIDQQITWAAYPILSIPAGWLILIPLMYRKYTIAVCVLTAIVAPFLYCMNKITPAPDWFCGLGIPLAAIGIVFVWAVYLLFRLVKISLWYKASITVFLAGVVNLITNHFLDRFLGTENPLFISKRQISPPLYRRGLI